MIDPDGWLPRSRLFQAAVFGLALAAADPVSADVLPFFVLTVHVDGATNARGDGKHPAEAFPAQPLPSGGGLELTPPDDDGNWRMRAFTFAPSQIIVHVGDEVELSFVGVQGPSHRIRIEGIKEEIELLRGEVKRVTLKPTRPGVIRFESVKRLPSMQGQVVVLPR